ncbi:hypothetical protein HN371_21715 [Candidatus Poribacteria bacterium]|jgi:GNAT superfamily N-acetyltransferase|nr:hypothetical protein [Candidatus Poribacteria bacterium]MBT5713628.1 hypothetical protein [Candidatus Poribacteria bacterium]MBT7099594.1 hypothetical protein [Candidatus Poribacteria bacterium]MBT7807081.1 hypothetical protein [Candidatus Poribacteria bacterium]
MPAIPDDIRRLLCDDGLGLDLLAQTAHYADDDDVEYTLRAVRDMLDSGDFGDLPELAEEEETAERLDALCVAGSVPGGPEAIRAYLEGLAVSLEREAAERAPVAACVDLEERIRATLVGLDFVADDDPLDILSPVGCPAYVDLLIAEFSPEYDGADVIWRDTQFKFEFLFESGLFLWLYGNVAEPFRGRRIGTQLFEAVEALALDVGFRRFCVPGPNKPYWERVMAYAVHPKHVVGVGGEFIHEAYKTLRALQ